MEPSVIKILLVDDIEENLLLLEDVLSEEGFSTVRAMSGPGAIQLLQKEEIHLIIADAMMPKMDGFELCKVIKGMEEYKSVPFIMYTGDYLDTEDEEFARKLGVDRYLMKSKGITALKEAVRELSSKAYGYQVGESVRAPEIDEQKFLEEHHAVLVKKLEQKMQELELYAETLAAKNRELAISEAKYRNLFQQVSVSIVVTDRETGKILDANVHAEQLMGYSLQQLQEMISLPFAEATGKAHDIVRSEELTTGEFVLRAKSGEEIDVLINAAPIDMPNDRRIILFIHDITEQKALKEQMLQVEKMSMMGKLVSGIAHEMRNPLAATTLNLQFLVQKYGDGFADKDSLEAALEGAQRMQQVIDKTLSLARPTQPLVSADSINEVVQRTLWFVNVPVQQKRLQIETNYGDRLPMVKIDAKQIQQVILNILQNAIDASQEGQTIRVSTGAFSEQAELFAKAAPGDTEKVYVTIRDFGIGISPDHFKNLFKPFHTTKAAGTGLGLALSKHIMERHQGEIKIEPAIGGGTIVYLVFPTTERKEIV